MSSSLICPACGNENAPDSRFCRHCGAALTATPSVTPENEVSDAAPSIEVAPAVTVPPVASIPVAPVAAAPVAPTATPANEEALSSPAEIDGRRARQLLDRALFLSERGDAGGAILACRQSIALAPTVAGGYAMLGLLLERSGDLARSVAAYEKAVQLAPDSVLERETLDRLREKLQGQQGASLFHFDDNELFSDEGAGAPTPQKAPAPVVAAPVITAPPAPSPAPVAPPIEATPQVVAPPVPVAEAAILGISAAAPGLPAEALPMAPASAANVATPTSLPTTAPVNAAPAASAVAVAPPIEPPAARLAPPLAPAPVIAERRRDERRQAAVAVAAERRRPTERRTTPLARPSIPISLPVTSRPASSWSNLWKRPSFYGQSLPLVAATVLSLGFLSWARSWAVARDNSNTPTVATLPPTTLSPTNPNPMANGSQQKIPPPSALTSTTPAPQNAGGFPISNRPISPSVPAAPAPVVSAPPSAPSNTAPRVVATAQRPASQTSTPRLPAAIPPASVSPAAPAPASGGGNNGGGASGLGLPAPVIPPPVQAPQPINIGPSDGTSPLNPGGSSARGYVKITQGHIGTVLPPRSTAQGNADERSAATASRTGQTDRAIDRLTSAINTGGADSGFRFQQRATLFLNRGDYSRAAEDFQSAISAYNDQINQGDQVASAKAGLQAARSGLNVALAGGRR